MKFCAIFFFAFHEVQNKLSSHFIRPDGTKEVFLFIDNFMKYPSFHFWNGAPLAEDEIEAPQTH